MKIASDPVAIVYRAGAEQKLVDRAKELQGSTSITSWELADIYVKLQEKYGWTGRHIAEACEVDEKHVSKFMLCAKKFSLVRTRPSFWEAFREVNSLKAVHVSQNTGQVEWYTPPEYIEAARQVMGSIDLDPATSEVAQKNVKAKQYFTAEEDGLELDWAGNVWLNPPYAADLVERFVDRLCGFFKVSVPQAILLVNNATETDWGQLAAKYAAAICFPLHRIKFLNEDNEPVGAPLQGQAIYYFGDAIDRFLVAFSSFGFCVRIVK